MIEGIKIVTAKEMARVEALAYANGESEVEYMESAGKEVAHQVEQFIDRNALEPSIILLAGKGNNAGDAYVAGRELLRKGFAVVAYSLAPFESCSPLCKQMRKLFEQEGGKIENGVGASLPLEGVIIDGLVGTGFQGAAEGDLAKMISQANASELPIVSIDIPSGVCGNSGKVETVAINASMTIYLGLPKMGCLIGDGWNHTGEFTYAYFGLKQEYIHQANPLAYLVDVDSLNTLMPKIQRNRHKYQAGYVLGVAGSYEMPGAALLSSIAALKSGAGIVRLFYPKGMEETLHFSPYELIKEGWDFAKFDRIEEEMVRAKAFFIGPGLGRENSTLKMLKKLLELVNVPTVLDADALYFLSQNPKQSLPKNSILTPHHQEMLRLLGGKPFNDDLSFLEKCLSYSEIHRATVVLKGAPTWIFNPKTPPFVIAGGDPGMATAGCGDVLTGMIAALLAQGLEPLPAALLGTALHGLAGKLAAADLTSYCMTASDLLEYLPDAFSYMLSRACE